MANMVNTHNIDPSEDKSAQLSTASSSKLALFDASHCPTTPTESTKTSTNKGTSTLALAAACEAATDTTTTTTTTTNKVVPSPPPPAISNVASNMNDIDAPPSLVAAVTPAEEPHQVDCPTSGTFSPGLSHDEFMDKSHRFYHSRRYYVMSAIACALFVAAGALTYFVLMNKPATHDGGSSTSSSPSSGSDGRVDPARIEYFNTLLDVLAKESEDLSSFGALYEPSSPQTTALEWLAYKDTILFEHDVPALLQRYALVVFYFSTGGSDFWDSPGDFLVGEAMECDWKGISCSGASSNQVIDVSLPFHSLVGTIPPELVFLKNLKRLDLSRNRLEGSIPDEFYAMSSLEVVFLSGNVLSGTLSPRISHLTKLETLFIGETFLSGDIPFSSLSQLPHLWSFSAPTALFSGSLHEIGQDGFASKLLWLDLSNNGRLEGSIPSSIGEWGSGLVHFNVDKTSISGSIPSEVGLLTDLKHIHGFSAQLTGTLPIELWNCKSLESINLADTRLEGTMPDGIGALTQLTSLTLANTAISGAIPTEIGLLTRLETLNIHATEFDGSVPTELGNLASLTTFFLHQTFLTGSVPAEVCSALGGGDLRVGCDDRLTCSCCGGCEG